ncbi:sensor histidine kinase [Silvimonas iriomotensis]|uniref:Histidine kinase domain-containing protein n=1 Tax=Silvimonas iriomotensis TaxID=449662 RepID=A0ABQ2PA18_9NEIS|nr:histidine kinase [Silvimonas iriomotensis]GGP21501.1 hypothetical protein GCM10010970_20790 [Silvimonas iriomotensis]
MNSPVAARLPATWSVHWARLSDTGSAWFALTLVLLNSLIGVSFWASGRGDVLWFDLLISNSIGFAAWGLGRLLTRGGRQAGLLVRSLIIAPVSVVVGVAFTGLTTGALPPFFAAGSGKIWLHLLPTFVAASVVCALVTILFQSMRMRTALETEKRRAAELRQSETAARLAMLQAQIEPHFLFNTLANVQSLISRDPERATQMLDHLNRYLRASLSRTRKPQSLLQEELTLIDALLSIAAIRLGQRLHYRIEVPDALRDLVLPPLLLQPLVENALLHGIEPAVDGGSITVSATREAGQLVLSVLDTGVGLGVSSHVHGGVGLSNVRTRLHTLYGERASLSVSGNAGGGVTARLIIPV